MHYIQLLYAIDNLFVYLMELKINDVDYTSIGKYMDNNDGIARYIPGSENDTDWINFLESEEPIIILWSLSYLQNEFHDVLEIYGEIAKTIIKSGGERLVLFLKKYYWDDTLDDMFIDFIFGSYSEYGGNNKFPKIIYNGNILDQERFDYGNHVFIESSRYAEFIKELNALTELMIQNVKANNKT